MLWAGVCECVCMRACVRACVCVCVCPKRVLLPHGLQWIGWPMRAIATNCVQERLWKQAAARALAYAALEHRPVLKRVPCPASKEIAEAVAAEVCPADGQCL